MPQKSNPGQVGILQPRLAIPQRINGLHRVNRQFERFDLLRLGRRNQSSHEFYVSTVDLSCRRVPLAGEIYPLVEGFSVQRKPRSFCIIARDLRFTLFLGRNEKIQMEHRRFQ
jgi:hypothetical protein